MYLSLDIETQGTEINTPIHYIGCYTYKNNKELFAVFKLPNDLNNFKTFINKRIANGYKFIYQNGKFDTTRLLFSYGIDLPIDHDTMYLGYLNSTVTELKEHKYEKWLSLKSMAQRYLGVANWDVDKKVKTSTEDKDVIPYLRLDCKYTYELFELLRRKLSKKHLKTYKLIIKLANCYKYIEYNGVPINKDLLLETQKKYKEKSGEVLAKLTEIAEQYGCSDINYNSAKQLQHLLFEKIKLPIIAYTKLGQPSTAVQTLKELLGKHECIDLLLSYRMYEKSLSFLKDWDERAIKHADGMYYIHPSFNLHSTVTGRTSSSGPNFQQIPRNKDLKSIFQYSGDEWRFVCADFSQAELRFASIIADVKNMKNAYKNGEDLHTNIAAIVNNIDKSKVTKPQRTAAKAINFGFIYGMSAESFVSYAKLSYGVIITQEESEKFREKYFALYPELNDYYSDIDDQLYYYGELESIMQRHYIIDIGQYYDRFKRESIKRAAINFPVQSAASDYVLCALYNVTTHPNLKDKVRVCGTVHDSIIMLVKNDETFVDNIKLIKNTMEYPPLAKEYMTKEIDIPIVVDVEIGPFGKGVSLEEYLEN